MHGIVCCAHATTCVVWDERRYALAIAEDIEPLGREVRLLRRATRGSDVGRLIGCDHSHLTAVLAEGYLSMPRETWEYRPGGCEGLGR
jgi:hypothetical protein